MADSDFDQFKIEIRQSSVDWGPFSFDFEDALPSGTTIASVTLNSYLGKVIPEDDIDDQTDTTSELVDAVLTAVSGSYGVNAYFNYPSTSTYIGEEKHTLVFVLTLDTGAVHSYYGHHVWCY